MSPEEREALASMTNRERKQAYYAKKKDKLTSLKRKDRTGTPVLQRQICSESCSEKNTEKRSVHSGTGYSKTQKGPDEGMRLNKFLANAGVAARRKADELIKPD